MAMLQEGTEGTDCSDASWLQIFPLKRDPHLFPCCQLMFKGWLNRWLQTRTRQNPKGKACLPTTIFQGRTFSSSVGMFIYISPPFEEFSMFDEYYVRLSLKPPACCIWDPGCSEKRAAYNVSLVLNWRHLAGYSPGCCVGYRGSERQYFCTVLLSRHLVPLFRTGFIHRRWWSPDL